MMEPHPYHSLLFSLAPIDADIPFLLTIFVKTCLTMAPLYLWVIVTCLCAISSEGQQPGQSITVGFVDSRSYTGNEGETVELRVVLSSVATTDITVDIMTQDAVPVSAEAPGDYDSIASTVIIPAGSSEELISIPFKADNVTENEETFMVQLSNPTNGATLSIFSLATVNIVDRDVAVVVFNPTVYNIEEANVFLDFIIELLTSTERQLQIDLNITAGTAQQSQDYISFPTTRVTIGVGARAGETFNAPVELVDDNNFEPTEYFTIAIDPNPAERLFTIEGQAIATANIIDNDGIIIGFDRTEYTVMESAPSVAITLRLVNGILSSDIVIALTTEDVTTLSSRGSMEPDFEEQNMNITFSPGSTEDTVTISIFDDEYLEYDEQFNCTLTLIAPNLPSIQLMPSLATVTITDNDNVVIGFNQTTYDVSEDEPFVVVYIELLSGTLRREVIVNVSTVEDSALGGSDYIHLQEQPLIFDMDTRIIGFRADIIDNVEFEATEQFHILLSTLDLDVTLRPVQATVRILDNDVITFTFRQKVYTFSEGSNDATVCVDKNGTSAQEVSVIMTGSVQSETINNTLVFPPNEPTTCATLNITDNDVALEMPTVFTLQLTEPENPLLHVLINSTMVVIIDDDVVEVGFKQTVYNVSEGSGVVQLAIERRGATAQPVTVTITRVGNDNSDAMVSNLTFSTSLEEIIVQNFTVEIIDDNIVESTERVDFLLNVTQEGIVIDTEADIATVNIFNDDNLLWDIGFQTMEYITSESSGILTAVIIINGSNVTSPFNIAIQAVNGTAIAGEDFDVISKQLTVTPGSETVPVIVAIYNNSDSLSFKNFSLFISTDESRASIIAAESVVYIFDDDFLPPTIETTGPMNIITDGQPATFVCTVTSSSDNISVSWLDENGDIIINASLTNPEYSIQENLIGAFQVVSNLSTSSFSLSSHLQSPLTCVGRVGNPVVERVATMNVMRLKIQLRTPTVSLSNVPLDISLGRNLSVMCTSSTSYGLAPDDIEVVPHIMWHETYEVDGEVVTNIFEATDIVNSTVGVFSSELLYLPILLPVNITCNSYLSLPSEVAVNSESSEYFIEVIPQEPSLNVTIISDPQIVADVSPYNNFTLTCNATIPSHLQSLQLIFTIRDLNQRNDIISQSSNLSILNECDMVNNDERLCTFTTYDDIQEGYSLGFQTFLCSVKLLSSTMFGSPPVERLITVTEEENTEFLTVNVPSLPAVIASPHVEHLSHNLAVIQWVVFRPTYTPETYYVQYSPVVSGNDTAQIFISQTVSGTTDLAAVNMEYDILLKGLENGTTYVANIVSNNTFGGRVSEDIFFRTNGFDIFPLTSINADVTLPVGAPITLVFNVDDQHLASINESTQLNFVALRHTPLTQPTEIVYEAGSNSATVTVSYLHAAPSLTGTYILCFEIPAAAAKRKRRGSLPLETQIQHLCSDLVVINVTVPTLRVSTNILVRRYREIGGTFIIDGDTPSVTCTPSDPRAPVQWLPNITDIDSVYQARLSPPHLQHTLSFTSVYASPPPATTIYFSCSLVNPELDSSQNSASAPIVTHRYIQSEVAILNDDNELPPNAIINRFSQNSLLVTCLGVDGHRNLTWEVQDGSLVPQIADFSAMSGGPLPTVYQSDYFGTKRLHIDYVSSSTAGLYYCRSQQSDFSRHVMITLTNPYWMLTTPLINYLPVGGRFSFVSVQFADNSTGYRNLGAGFSYDATFIRVSPEDNKQSQMNLETGLTSSLLGSEYLYRAVTRLNELDGVYQINATHIESGMEFSDSVEVAVIIPHFVALDQFVFSHIGDLLTLTCLPNDTAATVIWLESDGTGGVSVLTSPEFTFAPADLNHFVTFNATQYAQNNFGQVVLPELQFKVTCSFVNGEDVSDLISPLNVTVILQEEQIRMSLGSSRNNSVLNNTIINTFAPSQTEQQLGSRSTVQGRNDVQNVPFLTVDCTATQGDHLPNWMMPFNDFNNTLRSRQYVDNYTARLELFNVSEATEGSYVCHSQISGHFTRFLLTRENPYMRAFSSSDHELSVTAGESVTLEFTVAMNSNGVTWDRDDVKFLFSNFDENDPLVISKFQATNPNYPHSFVYTIERVNRSHAGVYIARALRQDCGPGVENCGEVSASITLNVTTYCPEEFNGGILWPRTLSDRRVAMPCRSADPLFEQRTMTTRFCDIDGVWSNLDLSTCTLVEESLTFVLVWFVLEVPHEQIADIELETEMRDLLSNRSVNFNNISLLLMPDSINGTAVRVEITLPSDRQRDEVSQLFEIFSVIGGFAISSMNRGFNIVIHSTSCACTPSNSTSIELCSGAATSPCLCNSTSNCQCQHPFVGDGERCTLDSDGDTYPDFKLISPICNEPRGESLTYCKMDNCPTVANPDQNSYDCTPDPPVGFDGCAYEVDNVWGISWPNTLKGSTTTQVCPGGVNVAVGTTTRQCSDRAVWGEPDVLQCISIEFLELLDLAGNLALLEPEEQVFEAARLTERLINVTKPSENKPLLPNDLGAAATIVTVIIDVFENNRSTDENIIDVYNNVLDDNNREGWRILQSAGLVASSELLLNSAERYALSTAMYMNTSSGEQPEVPTRRQSRLNIVVVGEQHHEPPIVNLQFPLPGDLVNYTASRKMSTISIPSSVIEERLEKLRDGENISVFFILLRNLPMGTFVVNTSTRAVEDNTCVREQFSTQGASDVLAAQIGSRNNNNRSFSESLQNSPVSLNFTFESGNGSTADSYRCVFWNFSDPIGNGSWMTDGVTKDNFMVQNTDAGKFTAVRCSSTHLTSFAVLVDVAGGLEIIRTAERTALQVISYIGCAISIICLLVTVIFFLWQLYDQRRLPDVKRVKTAQNFIHLNLALSLLLAFIVFIMGVETATGSQGGCAFVAFLLHYLFLSAFCWMLCEGILLYLLLRVVFSEMSKKWWPFLLIGYVTPLPIVIITVGARHQYYGVRDSCGDLLYCWLSVDEGTIFGFVAPMLAIILVNVFFMILALHTLWTSRRSQVQRKHDSTFKASQELGRALFVASLVLLPLLGITWAFGILTVNVNTTAFAWLFTIFNSLQGMFIFFFHVIRSDKVWGKISPKLLALRSKVPWMSAYRWHDTSTGETATQTKTKSSGLSTLPQGNNWILLEKGARMHKKGGLTSSMADSLNSTSIYELRSIQHVASEFENEIKVDLGSTEHLVDTGATEDLIINDGVQASTTHHNINIPIITVSDGNQPDKQLENQSDLIESTGSLVILHAPVEQDEFEQNSEENAEIEENNRANSVSTDKEKKEDDDAEACTIIESPSTSKEEEKQKTVETDENRSKTDGDIVIEVIENSLAEIDKPGSTANGDEELEGL